MTIRSKSTLPQRPDLNAVVQINPDEAGIFDLLFAESFFPDLNDDVRRDEVDLILDTGVDSDNEVLEAEYINPLPDVFMANVIGVPADTAEVSRWTVTFQVTE